MAKGREKIEATLEAPGAYPFLDLASGEAAESVARCVEQRLRSEGEAIDTALADALPRMPGWLRPIVRSALERPA